MIALLLLGWALAAPPEEDPVALAALLVADGHWERAAAVLEGVTPAEVDAARYHRLRGLVLLEQERYAAAATELSTAVALEDDAPTVLYLARALLLDERPAEAIAALDASAATEGFPGAWLIRARASWNLGDLDAAWAALAAGGSRFPGEPDFARQQVMLLVDSGLFREAGERAIALVDGVEVADLLVLAEALTRAGEPETALVVLEEARARHPNDIDLLVRSAAIALEAGQPFSAARHLQVAAELDPALALEAAELFRQAGDIDSALYMNAQVTDPVGKVRQRLGLLLDAGHFDRAVALAPRLERLGVLDEDAVAYGLAYACFRVGDATRAESLLRGIGDPEVFAQATALREALARCREAGECR